MGETKVRRIEIHGNSGNPKDDHRFSMEEQSNEDKTLKKFSEMEVELPEVEVEAELIDEAEQWRDKYLRLYAELENIKKRLAKKLEIELQEETSAVLLDLLPVADNLERIVSYARESGDKELERGLEITLKAFQEAMTKHGVSQIEARGKPFNPEVHEAIGAVPAPEFEEGTVLTIEQTGYFLDGKVLRPAKVVIASR
jgi:molecular chaperone GrpE